MSKNIRNITVVSSNEVTKQNYPCSYVQLQLDGETLSAKLLELVKTSEMILVIPDGFDFNDEYVLEELADITYIRKESKLFYSDFRVIKGEYGIAQFLPAMTPEIINHNLSINCPILFYGINDNLGPILKDKEELCWEILKVLTTNGILSYHIPKFFFIKR